MERTIDINDLAVKLDKVAREIDPYNYDDAEYSVECAKSDLMDRPLLVIDNLLDMMSELLDSLN